MDTPSSKSYSHRLELRHEIFTDYSLIMTSIASALGIDEAGDSLVQDEDLDRLFSYGELYIRFPKGGMVTGKTYQVIIDDQDQPVLTLHIGKDHKIKITQKEDLVSKPSLLIDIAESPESPDTVIQKTGNRTFRLIDRS